MKSSILSKWSGAVTVIVRGGDIEGFINEVTAAGIQVWDIKPRNDRKMELCMKVDSFFTLRPLLKRTGCRVSVKERFGLPFMLLRIWRRKWFAAGFILFAAVLFSLTRMVWDIEVTGNDKIAKQDILLAAKEEGLYPFQWTFALPSQDKLSANLSRKLQGISWVGVSRTGTKVHIQIVEATEPEKKLVSPSHLVSKADGVITFIYAEKGQPEVKKHDRVKKGQILVSGYQGGKAVVSKGQIRANVWHEYEIEVPLIRKQNVFTGEEKERGYLYFGRTAIQLTGYGADGFESSRVTTEFDPLTWRSFQLPIGWMSEKIQETAELEFKLSEEKAAADGIERAKEDILAKNGADTTILNQKILHEKTDNGKVYMKVLFEVEQSIAEELPIVYDQGE
ncbi:sporulation protein YqfD [Paenibacillus brevis]|uniref:Sporulation protein YqfD n=1 Tax=Paenibacillus brevis TaxID=2841508 RepID=A0ABS6FWF8_9BACL|nr:sporulation protein YqfD [Paenibacillus brevis]MBU5674572.1 sporulation protein YqfD [Paenibacillus brevis]